MRFLDSLRSLGMTISAVVSILLLAGCCNCVYTVTVTNPTDADRHPEMVELDFQDLGLAKGESFIVKNESGDEIPYQITQDGKVLFLVETVKAKSTASFNFKKGTPAPVQTVACGKEYTTIDGKPIDVAWENDHVGFRLYSDNPEAVNVVGYDLFAKRGTTEPVLDSFYAKNTKGTPAWDKYYELLATEGNEAATRYKVDSLSFHVDRGYGLDCYQVGPTLGAGVAALVEDGRIIYPDGYVGHEVIENGPLRFQTKLTFAPRQIGKDSSIVETRIITLDAGSNLNRTNVHYQLVTLDKDGKTKSENITNSEIITGIVLHEKGGDSFQTGSYISYAAPTQVIVTEAVEIINGNENGTLYVGHVYPKEVKNTANSEGHILTINEYDPETGFEYYWGFGWDKAGVESHKQWNEYLETYASMVRNPLTITRNN